MTNRIQQLHAPRELHSLVDSLANKSVLVIGDVILDEYVTGKPTRMSREAPVPVLELESRRYVAGGSANPSANIVSLGSRAIQVGVIGADDPGQRLARILRDQGIDVSGLFCCADRPTTVKTRILAQMGLRFPQQVTRIDTLTRQPIDSATEAKILEFVITKVDSVDAVLLSHYHGGLLTKSLVRKLSQLCLQNDILLTADAQGEFEIFRNIDVIKCNAEDAQRFLNCDLETDEDFGRAASKLGEMLEIKNAAIITRGSHGASLASGGIACHCPAPKVSDVFDTVGAGDTAIATLTLAMAGGIAAPAATMLANYASGLVVQHLGNYAPSLLELRHSIENAL